MHKNHIAFQIEGSVFQENYKVSYELISQLAYSRLEKLDNNCCSLGSLFLKTGIIFAIFNRSGKTPVEKERLIRYARCFAIIYFCWNAVSAYCLFLFICFMIELTFSYLVGFKKNELVTEFEVNPCNLQCMNNVAMYE